MASLVHNPAGNENALSNLGTRWTKESALISDVS